MTKKTAQKSLPVLTRPDRARCPSTQRTSGRTRASLSTSRCAKGVVEVSERAPELRGRPASAARYGKSCPVCAGRRARGVADAGPEAKRARRRRAAAPLLRRRRPARPLFDVGAPPSVVHTLSAQSGGFVVRDALCADGALRVPAGGFRRRSPRPRATRRHVLVVDRSGSMYGDMTGLQSTLIKLLAVEELRRPTCSSPSSPTRRLATSRSTSATCAPTGSACARSDEINRCARRA